MKRKWISALVCALITGCTLGNSYASSDAQNTVCLWDFHGTLVERDNVAHYMLVCKLAFLAFVLCREAVPILLEAKDRQAAGEYTEGLLLAKAQEFKAKEAHAHESGDTHAANSYRTTADRLQQIAQIVHSFELIYSYKKGMIELLCALQQCGITDHRIASNTGIIRYPELKELFSEILNDDMVRDGLVVDSTEIPMLKKPDYLFVKKLASLANPDGTNRLIFIDDLKENVDAANNSNLGIIGIHMTSVEQLTAAFKELGIDTTAGTPAQVAVP